MADTDVARRVLPALKIDVGAVSIAVPRHRVRRRFAATRSSTRSSTSSARQRRLILY